MVAKTLWDAPQELKFDEPISDSDPRFVDTTAARADEVLKRLLRSLGVDTTQDELKFEASKSYTLFHGHRGCGKSTELRRLKTKLHHPSRYYVVFLDALAALDINNLQYSDVLLALATQLFKDLEAAGIEVPEGISPLQHWFSERIEKHEQTRDYAAEIKTSAQAKIGIPFLAELFASITTSFRVNSTYKEEVRKVITNSFSEFASALNTFITHAEERIRQANKGRKLLFIVDGTDRLSEQDCRRFFIGDAYQLQLVESNFIYCAPISLVYEGTQAQNLFKCCGLPMLKLRLKQDSAKIAAAYDCMREMVFRRIDRHLFDSPETVDRLIEYSGGNPRHLLRLLDYAFQYAEADLFDRRAIDRAIGALSTEYKHILVPDDYKLLVEIDRSPEEPNNERVQWLLYHLALLEYNSFFRLSHPVIRELPGYQAALAAASY